MFAFSRLGSHCWLVAANLSPSPATADLTSLVADRCRGEGAAVLRAGGTDSSTTAVTVANISLEQGEAVVVWLEADQGINNTADLPVPTLILAIAILFTLRLFQ